MLTSASIQKEIMMNQHSDNFVPEAVEQKQVKSSFADVPIIDVQAYLDKNPDKWELECKKVA